MGTDDNSKLSPNASPDRLRKGKGIGVKRVNNIPLLIVLAIAITFLIVISYIANNRANKPIVTTEETTFDTKDSKNLANDIVSDYSGIIPAEIKKEEIKEELVKPIQILTPEERINPPMPPRDEIGERIKIAKLQMMEQAIRSKTSVSFEPPRSQASATAFKNSDMEFNTSSQRLASIKMPTGNNDAFEIYKQRLAQIKSLQNQEQVTQNPSLGLTQHQNTDNINNKTIENEWKLDQQVEAPESPFIIRSGFIIPGILISGINSDLPGRINAQVSQNVYDTPVGRYLLIPQGSKLIGEYSSDIVFGQERVLIAWKRIVFPDGKALDIQSMPGTDQQGYSGFKDQVNNHFIRTFGSAILMSGIVAGIELSQDKNNNNNNNNNSNNQRSSDAMSEALGQALGQVIAQMVSKNLNIAPTLEIRPGYRFNIIVIKDMIFTKPYQSFDY